jgi:hypothetical protein
MTFKRLVYGHTQRPTQTFASARDVDHLNPQLLDALNDRRHNMASILIKD